MTATVTPTTSDVDQAAGEASSGWRGSGRSPRVPSATPAAVATGGGASAARNAAAASGVGATESSGGSSGGSGNGSGGDHTGFGLSASDLAGIVSYAFDHDGCLPPGVTVAGLALALRTSASSGLALNLPPATLPATVPAVGVPPSSVAPGSSADNSAAASAAASTGPQTAGAHPHSHAHLHPQSQFQHQPSSQLPSKAAQWEPVDGPARRAVFGVNCLPPAHEVTFWELVLEALDDFTVQALLASGLLSLALSVLTRGGEAAAGAGAVGATAAVTAAAAAAAAGAGAMAGAGGGGGGGGSADWLEGMAILGTVALVVTVSAATGYAKESKFRQLNSLNEDVKVLVVRGGRPPSPLPARDVLVGDLLVLEAGDILQADGVLVSGGEIRLDQSHLTGESEDVGRSPGDPTSPCVVLSGSKVLDGYVKMLVLAVGPYSQQGNINAMMRRAGGGGGGGGDGGVGAGRRNACAAAAAGLPAPTSAPTVSPAPTGAAATTAVSPLQPAPPQPAVAPPPSVPTSSQEQGQEPERAARRLRQGRKLAQMGMDAASALASAAAAALASASSVASYDGSDVIGLGGDQSSGHGGSGGGRGGGAALRSADGAAAASGSGGTGSGGSASLASVEVVEARGAVSPPASSPSLPSTASAAGAGGSPGAAATGATAVVSGGEAGAGTALAAAAEGPEGLRVETFLMQKLQLLAQRIGGFGVAAAAGVFLANAAAYTASLVSLGAAGPGAGGLPPAMDIAQSYLDLVITSITILVVAVPEGLPLAVTLALAFSVQRMLADNNLVRHLGACETMGAATTICSDKTGTLTSNNMTVVRLWLGGRSFRVDHSSSAAAHSSSPSTTTATAVPTATRSTLPIAPSTHHPAVSSSRLEDSSGPTHSSPTASSSAASTTTTSSSNTSRDSTDGPPASSSGFSHARSSSSSHGSAAAASAAASRGHSPFPGGAIVPRAELVALDGDVGEPGSSSSSFGSSAPSSSLAGLLPQALRDLLVQGLVINSTASLKRKAEVKGSGTSAWERNGSPTECALLELPYDLGWGWGWEWAWPPAAVHTDRNSSGGNAAAGGSKTTTPTATATTDGRDAHSDLSGYTSYGSVGDSTDEYFRPPAKTATAAAGSGSGSGPRSDTAGGSGGSSPDPASAGEGEGPVPVRASPSPVPRVLQLLPFSSHRKRMTVVVEAPAHRQSHLHTPLHHPSSCSPASTTAPSSSSSSSSASSSSASRLAVRVLTKGAAELVLERCSWQLAAADPDLISETGSGGDKPGFSVVPLNAEQKKDLLASFSAAAGGSLRVLALAYRDMSLPTEKRKPGRPPSGGDSLQSHNPGQIRNPNPQHPNASPTMARNALPGSGTAPGSAGESELVAVVGGAASFGKGETASNGGLFSAASAGPSLARSVPLDADFLERDMVLVALVGLQDPLRPEVPASVAACTRAGITVRMVTGDNITTAASIAQQAGILPPDVDVRQLVAAGPRTADLLAAAGPVETTATTITVIPTSSTATVTSAPLLATSGASGADVRNGTTTTALPTAPNDLRTTISVSVTTVNHGSSSEGPHLPAASGSQHPTPHQSTPYTMPNLAPYLVLEGATFRQLVTRTPPGSGAGPGSHTSDGIAGAVPGRTTSGAGSSGGGGVGGGCAVVDEEAFLALWPRLRVLARCSPGDKYLLVSTLRRLREEGRLEEVVAVTGDGTNDAPALTAADVGFCMNNGTPIAKEAADILLLDSSFTSITSAVAWGRNVYASVTRFLQFQLTANVVAVAVAAGGAVWLRYSPLSAVQMLWVNLIMDSLASLALATEAPTEDMLDAPPNRPNDPLVTPTVLKHVAGQAAFQLAVLYGILFALHNPHQPDAATAAITATTAAASTIPTIIPVQGTGLGLWSGAGGGGSGVSELGAALAALLQGGTTASTAAAAAGGGGASVLGSTLVFNTFVQMQLFNQLNCRRVRDESNVLDGLPAHPLFLAIVASEALLQYLIVQYGGEAFNTTPLTGPQWALCVGLGATGLLVRAGLRVLRV